MNLRAFGELGPMARIDAVRIGVPSTMLTELASAMAVSREVLLAWIGMARTTANNKLRTGASLSPEQGEKALGVAQLIALVDRVVRESGDAAGFDAARWTARWLQEPSPALGDRRPGDLMDTADGRAIVRRLVAQMQSGAYA